MAKQRTKSLEQIYKQADDLLDEMNRRRDYRRAERVRNITIRYNANIRDSRQGKKDFDAVLAKYNKPEGAKKEADVYFNRQHSRSTYMGLSNT